MGITWNDVALLWLALVALFLATMIIGRTVMIAENGKLRFYYFKDMQKMPKKWLYPFYDEGNKKKLWFKITFYIYMCFWILPTLIMALYPVFYFCNSFLLFHCIGEEFEEAAFFFFSLGLLWAVAFSTLIVIVKFFKILISSSKGK